MLERPLLYIMSPTYWLDVSLDESTSIYERVVPKQVKNELIERQLHYFARMVKPRSVILLLETGERVLGVIQQVHETEVTVACFEQVRVMSLDTIVAIYATK